MHATQPFVRATFALIALLGAAPALAQYREPPPPEPWPESARHDDGDDDQRPPPPAPRADRDDRDDRRDASRSDGARPAPPAGPYYPARPAYRTRHRAPPPGYAPGYPPGYAPQAYAPRRQDYLWPRVEVALRGGVASPGGSAVGGVPMRDLFGNQLTLGVDVGLRANPHLYMGLFAEGGLGMGGDAIDASCRGTNDCGAASGRLGAALHYHFAPYAPLDPWIGYGVALSAASVTGSDALGTYERTFAGVEYAKLMAGVDMRLGGSATLGLYAEWTSGVFSQIEARNDGVIVDSGSVGDTTTHSWFTMGPRLKF
jgi:hypothetical protein